MRKFSITDFTSIFQEDQASKYHLGSRPRKSFSVFISSFCEHLDIALSLLKPRHKQVLNSILGYSNRYKIACPSQTTIGLRNGLHRATVNDAISDLEYLGLIKTNYRHMKTSEYLPASNFLDPKIRSKYAHLFRALFVMPWTFLLANSGMPLNLKATQYNNKSFSKVYISLGKDRFNKLASNLTPYLPLISPFIPRQVVNHASILGFDSIKQVTSNSKRMDMEGSPIRESIRSLKSLNLTKWGQIELMKFPDDAIEHAARSLIMTRPKEPMLYFLKICHEYCKNNNIRPDYDTMKALLNKYPRPEKFELTIKPLTGAQFAHKVVAGIGTYNARQLESSKQVVTPARNRLMSAHNEPFTIEQLRERKLAREKKLNDKLIACGKQPLAQSTIKDPFSFDEVGMKSYFSSISSFFLAPLIKLGLNSPNIEPHKKLVIVKVASQLNIPLKDLISSEQIESIISSISPSDRDGDTLITNDPQGDNRV